MSPNSNINDDNLFFKAYDKNISATVSNYCILYCVYIVFHVSQLKQRLEFLQKELLKKKQKLEVKYIYIFFPDNVVNLILYCIELI